MKVRYILSAVLCAVGLLAAGCAEKSNASAPSDGPEAVAAASTTYDGAVKTVFEAKCGRCHVEGNKGGLSLASLSSLMAGGESGPVVVPGDADGSLLYKMVSGAAGVKRMPPKGEPLTADELASVRQWIIDGAS